MPATRRAIIVLPAPGGPISSRLCPPAAAISSARRARSCPRTSARSSASGARGAGGLGRAMTALEGSLSARTASASDDTPSTSRPDTIAASPAFDAGNRIADRPSRLAAAAIGSTPRVPWIDPSSDNSPRSTISGTCRRSMTPDAARMPSAIGRSNAAPALRTSAGARLTVIRCGGNSNPELRIALRTRSRLSRTLASGRPTIVNTGMPKDTSTSTCTGQASTPITAAVRRHASTSR